jgi:hypothetical protein
VKKFYFIVLMLSGILLTGCYLDDGDEDEKDTYGYTTLSYSGHIDGCYLEGNPCKESPYCKTTYASSISTVNAECYKIKGRNEGGYDTLTFQGLFEYCYFNGNKCEYNSRQCYKFNGATTEGTMYCSR